MYKIKQEIIKRGFRINENGCWNWLGTKNDAGYGIITIRGMRVYKQRVHRLMYKIYKKDNIDELNILHACDNRLCINPKHLFHGTQKDNVDDMCKKRRHWAHNRLRCKNGHDVTIQGSIKSIEHRGRKENLCVLCDINRKKRWYLKNKLLK